MSTSKTLPVADASTITETVRQRYSAAANLAAAGQRASCCSPVDLTLPTAAAPRASCCGSSDETATGCGDPITDNLYDGVETAAVPAGAVLASLGCGNPTALAELKAGEVVLDLGSGGGIDVLLSARRVGPTGKAYGLDMTDEMLALARKNQAESGLQNVEFLKGQIESVPLPDASVDVIISNCVINLSSDKRTVLREAFRVLKPGGRLAISDVLSRGEIPDEIRSSMEAWVGCIAGAMDECEFLDLAREVGFVNASVEPTREYAPNDARTFLEMAGVNADDLLERVEGRFISGFVRATKP
jgi:SAM-dependent methyltransferase